MSKWWFRFKHHCRGISALYIEHVVYLCILWILFLCYVLVQNKDNKCCIEIDMELCVIFNCVMCLINKSFHFCLLVLRVTSRAVGCIFGAIIKRAIIGPHALLRLGKSLSICYSREPKCLVSAISCSIQPNHIDGCIFKYTDIVSLGSFK